MVDVKVKNLFFDRKIVIAAIGKARAGILSKAGAYIRRTARSLLRYGAKKARGVSQPGQPPITHTRDETISLRNIQFSYDPASKSVVVGPVRISRSSEAAKPAGTVPQVLEHGGEVTLREALGRNGWRTVTRPTGNQLTRTRNVSYAARPFMAPSLQQNIPKVPELWKDAIVKGK